MERAEFLGIMREMNAVYGERKFPLTAQTVDIWNRYLGEYEAADIREAVRRYVKKSPFPPTVAELLEEYKRIQNEALLRAVEDEALFRSVVAAYPCATGSEAERTAFNRLTGGDRVKSRQALTITRNIVLGWELTGEHDIPPLKDFLGRIKL